QLRLDCARRGRDHRRDRACRQLRVRDDRQQRRRVSDGYGAPLAGPSPLIDVHAHFYQQGSGRASWKELNASRLAAGERIGITWHVGSILGSWGATSPVYFQSPADTIAGNDAMLQVQAAEQRRVRTWAAVNPNETDAALNELERCRQRGAVG